MASKYKLKNKKKPKTTIEAVTMALNDPDSWLFKELWKLINVRLAWDAMLDRAEQLTIQFIEEEKHLDDLDEKSLKANQAAKEEVNLFLMERNKLLQSDEIKKILGATREKETYLELKQDYLTQIGNLNNQINELKTQSKQLAQQAQANTQAWQQILLPSTPPQTPLQNSIHQAVKSMSAIANIMSQVKLSHQQADASAVEILTANVKDDPKLHKEKLNNFKNHTLMCNVINANCHCSGGRTGPELLRFILEHGNEVNDYLKLQDCIKEDYLTVNSKQYNVFSEADIISDEIVNNKVALRHVEQEHHLVCTKLKLLDEQYNKKSVKQVDNTARDTRPSSHK